MNRIVIVLAAVLLQGCATAHNGRHQDVEVVTDPAGATVEVRCGNPQPVAVTPTTVRLPRGVDDCSLVLTRTGFRPETVAFESTVSGWVWGNFAATAAGGVAAASRQSDDAFIDILIGGVLGGAGFGIDAMTGAMWQYEPPRVVRTLTPE